MRFTARRILSRNAPQFEVYFSLRIQNLKLIGAKIKMLQPPLLKTVLLINVEVRYNTPKSTIKICFVSAHNNIPDGILTWGQ